MSEPARSDPPASPPGPPPWFWGLLAAVCFWVGISGNGSIGPGRFVALIAAVVFVVVAFRETPWPEPPEGPPPDEVDRMEREVGDGTEEREPRP